MKAILLTVFSLFFLSCFAQKKLIAYNQTNYDESGGIITNKSNTYIYNSWHGSLADFEPKFIIQTDYFSYFRYDSDYSNTYYFIHFDTCIQNTTTMSSTVTETIIGQKTNGITSSQASNSESSSYIFDSFGQILEEAHLTGASTPIGATKNEYDSNGNLIVTTKYTDMIGGTIQYVDSMFYSPNSNEVYKLLKYQVSPVTSMLNQTKKIEVNYTGSNIDYVDIFTNVMGVQTLTKRYKYGYTGNILENYEVYHTDMNGTPNSTFEYEKEFAFNGMGQLAGSHTLFQGDTIAKRFFEYDSDGFLVKRLFYDKLGGPLHLSYVTEYTFANTASIQENELIDVNLFPNPISDILTIETEENIQTVSIYNLSGQLLIKQVKGQIDVSHLSAGEYILKGNTDRGTFSKKFIKK